MPSLAELDAIVHRAEPVTRNLGITQAYHELSAGLAARTGPAANWCTFATWASKQAGQTIRGQDLARLLEAELDAEEIGTAVSRLGDVLRAVGHTVDRNVLVATVRDVVSPVRAAERAGEAVSRGNAKVFEELGPAFARLLAGSDPKLRPGPPPDGQDLLRGAFAAYARAVAATDARRRAEQVLLGTLRIGLHEQTRLQPEIRGAMDAALLDVAETRRRVLDRLAEVIEAGPLGRVHSGEGRLLLNAVADEIAEELRLAAHALGRLLGRIDVEDVLEAIFRDFCIGK